MLPLNSWMGPVTCREAWHNVILLQVAISTFFTKTTDFILKRYGLSAFFSNMVGAMIIGPALLGQTNFFKEFIFPYHSLYVLETLHYLGNMLFPFMVGLRMDFRMMSRSRLEAKIIGFSIGFFPFLISYLTSFILKTQYFSAYPKKSLMLCAASVTSSQTLFHDVACLLADLKILNSKIGRLAISSSMISNCCSFCMVVVVMAVTQSEQLAKGLVVIAGSLLGFVLFIVYVLKPITHWMIKQIPQGSNNIEELYVVIVFLMVMVSSLFGQFLGHSPGLGSLLMGLVVPPGPPLAESIEDKLESIVSYFFLPLFYCACCGKAVVGGTADETFLMFVGLIVFVSFFTKIITAVLSSMYCGLSLNDALVLGLIIASPGLMLLIYFSSSLRYGHMDTEVYGVLLYFSTVLAGITSILVKLMYRPSVDYLSYKKRSLRENIDDTKFRILACIYQDSNVKGMMNLLEVSNPTKESPISLHLLHLIELQRIAPPFLISHKETDVSSIYYERSKHIINAFQFFKNRLEEKITLKVFSALSPCATMHQDICSLAMELAVSLIILPFHRQFSLDGIIEETTTIRNVNSNVLNLWRCSIGILVDQRRTNVSNSIAQIKSFFHIAIIFLGGADDREVLTYGMRMAKNPNTDLTVICFNIVDDDTDSNLKEDKTLDVELLNDYKHECMGREGMRYMEEVVSDSVGIADTLREVENMFDLLMVGRQHKKESKFFEGLSEWSEYPELGFMGDMLATSNFLEDVPILVLQQKLHYSDGLVLDPNYTLHV